MAFSGTELLEVTPVPNQMSITAKGGDFVINASFKQTLDNYVSNYLIPFSIKNTMTGEALLYDGPSVGVLTTGDDAAIAVWWDGYNSRWLFCGHKRYSGANGYWVAWISNTGDSGNIYSHAASSEQYSGIAGNNSWIQLISKSPSSNWGVRMALPSLTRYNLALYTTSVIEADGNWWVTLSTNLYSQDPSTDARTLVTNLGVNVTSRVIVDGDWFWWITTSPTTPYVGWNRVTNTVRRIKLTPSSGVPTLNPIQYPAVLDGVIYGVTSDYTKVLAVDIASGKWKYDDPVTARSGRSGVAAANGKLWIPSTVTPP